MSFGRPGALSDTFKVSPPQRGSFPLDHDGECKTFMLSYMKCLKTHKLDSGRCRLEAKDYLGCRMDNGLMERDSFDNLGLGNLTPTASATAGEAGASTSTSTGSAKPPPESQAKPEMERI